MRVLVVDNYDSFVYNLVQYLAQLGAESTVRRNDAVDLDELGRRRRRAALSPGPGTPGARPGVCIDRDPRAAPARGCRCSGSASATRRSARPSAASSMRAPELLHGKTSLVHHDGAGVLAGLPDPFTATRYHSLAVGPGDRARRARGHRPRPTSGVDHGAAPPRAADRGRAVPPRVGAHRGRPPDAGQLAGRAGHPVAGTARGRRSPRRWPSSPPAPDPPAPPSTPQPPVHTAARWCIWPAVCTSR